LWWEVVGFFTLGRMTTHKKSVGGNNFASSPFKTRLFLSNGVGCVYELMEKTESWIVSTKFSAVFFAKESGSNLFFFPLPSTINFSKPS
jgi:hypothetical protein